MQTKRGDFFIILTSIVSFTIKPRYLFRECLVCTLLYVTCVLPIWFYVHQKQSIVYYWQITHTYSQGLCLLLTNHSHVFARSCITIDQSLTRICKVLYYYWPITHTYLQGLCLLLTNHSHVSARSLFNWVLTFTKL